MKPKSGVAPAILTQQTMVVYSDVIHENVMQHDQQCDHPGDQSPVQLYMHTSSVLR